VRLILFTIVGAFLLGLVTGGTVRDFPSVRLRWWGLAFAGVGLQLVPLAGTAGSVALFASFAALIAFGVMNVSAPGFALVIVGLALNALVIVANQGMPVTEHALMASGQQATLEDLVRDGGAKHHLADADTRLLFLGDVIAIGPPIEQAISIGDVCVQLGAAWFIVGAMPRRTRRAVEREATT
jgi:hypothetical protein